MNNYKKLSKGRKHLEFRTPETLLISSGITIKLKGNLAKLGKNTFSQTVDNLSN